MASFTRWLRAVTEPAAGSSSAPPAPTLRELLAAAQTRRQEAQRRLDEAIAGTERARQTIPDAALAEAEAAIAAAIAETEDKRLPTNVEIVVKPIA